MKKLNLVFALASVLLLSGCNSKNKNVSSVSSEDLPYKELNITKPIKTLDTNACPSTGKIKALVVPVHFSDDTETSIDMDLIRAGFDTPSDSSIVPEWTSVKSFYSQSSYENLDFEFTFADTYTPSSPSSYYASKANFNGDDYNTNASRALYKEILEHYDSLYDYSDYDSDKDGIIDALYMVYDHDIQFEATSDMNMFWWAYTSWCTDEQTFDGVKMGKYVWYAQKFFTKDNLKCNTQTIIHETSHLFGIDDYYDYDTSKGASKGGLGGADLMDNANGSPCGDHNAYSKALLNWIKPKVVTADEATFTLESFQNNGDAVILANDFDFDKEMYQEYFLLEYYTPTGLQAHDLPFTTSGIKVYHVASSLTKKGVIKNNNSDTSERLISQITNKNGDTYINSSTTKNDSTLFKEGESLEKAYYNDGTRLKYKFEVVSESNDKCTIKISLI